MASAHRCSKFLPNRITKLGLRTGITKMALRKWSCALATEAAIVAWVFKSWDVEGAKAILCLQEPLGRRVRSKTIFSQFLYSP